MSGSNRNSGTALIISWIIISVLSALLLGSYISSKPSQSEPHQASTKKYKEKNAQFENVFSRKAPNWVIPRDTPAQWVMAVFAVVATGATIYAAYLLKITLQATRETLREAGRTTAAAQATNSEAQQANLNSIMEAGHQKYFNRRQIRAYMVTNEAHLEEEYTDGVQICFAVRNSGQTPAYDVVVRKAIVLWNADFKDKEVPDEAEMLEMDPIIVGPGDGIMTSITKPLTAKERDSLRKGDLVCLVFGTCTYFDIFDNTDRIEANEATFADDAESWHTQFTYKLDRFGDANPRVVPYGTTNKAT